MEEHGIHPNLGTFNNAIHPLVFCSFTSDKVEKIISMIEEMHRCGIGKEADI